MSKKKWTFKLFLAPSGKNRQKIQQVWDSRHLLLTITFDFFVVYLSLCVEGWDVSVFFKLELFPSLLCHYFFLTTVHLRKLVCGKGFCITFTSGSITVLRLQSYLPDNCIFDRMRTSPSLKSEESVTWFNSHQTHGETWAKGTLKMCVHFFNDFGDTLGPTFFKCSQANC